MMKKAIAIAGAGAVLLGMVVPALAGCRGGRCDRPEPKSWDVDVAVVENAALAGADTGDNMQMGMASSSGGDASVDQWMDTGNANASATAVTVANTEVSCRCRRDPCECEQNDVDVALVRNAALAGADTGDNMQMGMASTEGGDKDGGPSCGGKRGGHHHDDGDAEDGSATVMQTMFTGNARSDADAWTVVNTQMR